MEGTQREHEGVTYGFCRLNVQRSGQNDLKDWFKVTLGRCKVTVGRSRSSEAAPCANEGPRIQH